LRFMVKKKKKKKKRLPKFLNLLYKTLTLMYNLYFVSLSTHLKLSLALCFSKTDKDTKVFIKITL